jgi:hypothetical protein
MYSGQAAAGLELPTWGCAEAADGCWQVSYSIQRASSSTDSAVHCKQQAHCFSRSTVLQPRSWGWQDLRELQLPAALAAPPGCTCLLQLEKGFTTLGKVCRIVCLLQSGILRAVFVHPQKVLQGRFVSMAAAVRQLQPCFRMLTLIERATWWASAFCSRRIVPCLLLAILECWLPSADQQLLHRG